MLSSKATSIHPLMMQHRDDSRFNVLPKGTLILRLVDDCSITWATATPRPGQPEDLLALYYHYSPLMYTGRTGITRLSTKPASCCACKHTDCYQRPANQFKSDPQALNPVGIRAFEKQVNICYLTYLWCTESFLQGFICMHINHFFLYFSTSTCKEGKLSCIGEVTIQPSKFHNRESSDI